MFDAWGNEKSKPTAMGPHRLWSICSWKRSSHSPFLLVSSFLDKWKNQNRFDINESNADLQHLHFFRPRSVMFEDKFIHIINNDDRFVVLIYYKFHWIHVEFDGRRTHAIGNDIMLRRSNFESVKEARLIEFHRILGISRIKFTNGLLYGSEINAFNGWYRGHVTLASFILSRIVLSSKNWSRNEYWTSVWVFNIVPSTPESDAFTVSVSNLKGDCSGEWDRSRLKKIC